jgi:RNA polymerase sigma-70 factor (ECF subfamily)
MEDELEDTLGVLLEKRKYDQLAKAAIEGYSSELYGYLVNTMRKHEDAAEVFSQTIEDFWRGLPRFRGGASVKTWLYKIAYSAVTRFRRSPWNRGDRVGDAALAELTAIAHTRTEPWRITEIKNKARALRDQLNDADQTLLTLRLDRRLDWHEIARIMLRDDDPSPAALARESGRLRKRFQYLKDELRARARASGLLPQ